VAHQLVRDIMTSSVITVSPTTPYKDIVSLLIRHRISAVPVIDADRRVLGVVSEADLVYKLEFASPVPQAPLFERKRLRIARQRAAGTTAHDLMTSPAVTVLEAESIIAAARRMDTERVKRLPVVNELGRLTGILARADVLRTYLREDTEIEAEIRHRVLQRTLRQQPDAIDVTVKDGLVTLAGGLDRRSTIALVVRLVEGVPGVVSVVSHLSYHYDDRRDHEYVPAALY
jgi:CBS domain-containing protein